MSQHPRLVFDLFAGCGGLSLGLENSGFVPALVCELDVHARSTYLRNRNHFIGEQKFKEIQDLHFGAVDTINSKNLNKVMTILQSAYKTSKKPEIDLIVGGPPCQGYSGIGHRRSYGVEKKELPSNRLFEPMAKLIKTVQPKIFLFENVKGILSGRWTKNGEKGEIWEDVRGCFRNLEGYTTNWKLIQAKDYGVPQNRPRVLLVGIRNDIVKKAGLNASHGDNSAVEEGLLPQSHLLTPPNLDELLSDLIDNQISNVLLSQNFPPDFSNKTYLREPETRLQKQMRTTPSGILLTKGDPLTEQEYSKHRALVVEKFNYMLENKGKIAERYATKKFAQRLLPQKWGNKGPSITATSLPDDYVHYQQPRILTVREWARLQTFPDWYEFSGKRTTGGTRRAGVPTKGIFDRELPKYTQIGNAVPVTLARLIGDHFSEILKTAGA
jgi:DNA (cytosine-5)-methyltransferase 1